MSKGRRVVRVTADLIFRISRYGVNPSLLRGDFPRYYPALPDVGLHRYESVCLYRVATILGRVLQPWNIVHPTRNFATLGRFSVLIRRLTNPRLDTRLMVAHEFGLYHLALSPPSVGEETSSA